MKQLARHWWPIPAMLTPIIAIQRLWFDRYTASGHAAGHLSSATAVFGSAFVLAVLGWAAPPPLRRRAEL